jgi:adenosylcobinamide-GDP ribazoletransferase
MSDIPPDSDDRTTEGYERHHPAAWFADIRTALGFLTRLPVGIAEGDLARAARLFPVAGALIGLAGGILYTVALELGLPALLAATLAVGGTILLTGALHEDGLADLADGLGGRGDAAERLAVMRDSRTGAFGVLALGLSLIARVAALAALPAPLGVGALVAAHALGRSGLPLVMAREPYARDDGLAVSAGRPRESDALLAVGLGAVFALLALGWIAGILAILLATLVTVGIARLARRRLGGQTGDVLGAIEQLAEILVLAVAATLAP